MLVGGLLGGLPAGLDGGGPDSTGAPLQGSGLGILAVVVVSSGGPMGCSSEGHVGDPASLSKCFCR